ncbi:gfo/Idh/MocA family oxidoreductase [Micromonospora globispora]|nr:Gfo/Idh/MocA family oxidoreductase [Micromonospora globispora]PWU60971.1 gfo/Idh/MocA family oxidoreductase [Micromonospora globispora]RQW82857.1 gfo/Idh/MocA family oxidoreductase [Micromonospora globispora]
MTLPVRWGVLGTARIAERYVVPAIAASDNGRVIAVSSGSGSEKAVAERLGIPRAYPSHDQLLADPDVDAVYIPLPNVLHRDWTIRAAEAGKHVLCEKPIALSRRQFDEVEAACAANRVHVAEAFMYRHHPQIGAVRDLLQRGRIGEVVAVEARFHFILDPAAGPNIRLDPALGGGALRDIGCYPIDLMNLLMGGPPTEVASVAVTRRDVRVETSIAAVLRYGTVLGSWDCSFHSPAGDSCVVIGSSGTIELRHPFRPDQNGGNGVSIVSSGGGADTVEVHGDVYRLEVEAFARRILADEPDEPNTELSRWTVETTERVAQAAGLPPFETEASSAGRTAG